MKNIELWLIIWIILCFVVCWLFFKTKVGALKRRVAYHEWLNGFLERRYVDKLNRMKKDKESFEDRYIKANAKLAVENDQLKAETKKHLER